MADNNMHVPNVMPDAMVEPITDMELIVAQLKYDGELNKHTAQRASVENKNYEVTR